MKRNASIFISALMLAAIAFTGCQSTKGNSDEVKKINRDKYSPVAVISVYSNCNLPWYIPGKQVLSDEEGDGNGGLLTRLLNNVIGSKDPEINTLYSRINDAASTLESEIAEAGVPVISHDTLTANENYQNLGNGFVDSLSSLIGAENYPISENPSGKKLRDINQEVAAKSDIIAYFQFKKVKKTEGVNEYRAYIMIEMEVSVKDENGKLVYNKTYKSVSDDSVAYSNGKWDKTKLVAMYPEVTKAVVDQFVEDFYGIENPEDKTVSDNAETSDSAEEEEFSTPISIPLPGTVSAGSNSTSEE